MQDELARIAAGLPVASLWPLTVPYLGKSRLRVALFAFLSALYILAPQLPSASSLFLLIAATAITWTLWSPDGEATEATSASWQRWLADYGPIAAALLLGLAAAAVIDLEASRDALKTVVDSNSVALACTGLIAAVFLGGRWWPGS